MNDDSSVLGRLIGRDSQIGATNEPLQVQLMLTIEPVKQDA